MEWDQEGQYLAVAEGTTVVVWCALSPKLYSASARCAPGVFRSHSVHDMGAGGPWDLGASQHRTIACTLMILGLHAHVLQPRRGLGCSCRRQSLCKGPSLTLAEKSRI